MDLILGGGVLAALPGSRRLSPALRAACALALGNGLSALALFVCLGLPHQIHPLGVRLLSVALVSVGAWLLTRERAWGWCFEGVLRPRRAWIWLLPLAPVILAFHVDLLYPPLDTDSTMYHMPSARAYAEHQRIRHEPLLRYNAHPQLTVVSYLRAWLLFGQDDTLHKLVNWEYLAIILFALAAMAGSGWRLALLLLGTCPVYWWTARAEYADLGLCAALTVTAAVLCVILDDSGDAGAALLLPLAGLLLGFAAATKLQGLVMAFFLALAFLACARRLIWIPASAWLVAGTALSGLPWWIRSFVYTGSPMAPFFTADARAKALARGMVEVSYAYGFGHGVDAFLMLPVRMITKAAAAWADPFIFGPALLVILVTAGVRAPGIGWRGVRRSTWFLIGGILAYALFWFQVGQVMRYLASLLPLMAVLWIRLRPSPWLAAPLLPLALFGFLTPSRILLVALPPPVTLSERHAVLASALPSYWTIERANRIVPAGERVYLLFCEDLRYHVRPRAAGEWFADLDYGWAGEGAPDAAAVIARIRAAGFRYLIVNRDRAAREGTLYEPDFLKTGFVIPGAPTPGATPLFEDGIFALFRLD